MRLKLFNVLVVFALLSSLLFALPVGANPPAPDDTSLPPGQDATVGGGMGKTIDQPNIKDYLRTREYQRLIESGQTAEAASLALTGQDRVLVILVEFAGTDSFTWTPGTSTWDPLGKVDVNDAVTDEFGDIVTGDCSAIITETRTFTYTGPLHNQIPRPLSASDRSGDSIWTPDFSNEWFDDFMFGDGVTFNFTRTDGSTVFADYTGLSVRQYYQEMSGGKYDITGDVIGWLQLPHSTWWYGADPCPGARSGPAGGFQHNGAIPGAGSARSLVRDAVNAVNAISNTIPGFSWDNYDQDGDGVVDRLWVVHAGYGEEDSPTLLNRTDYGEAAIWSHSSSVTPAYPVSADVAVGPYIMMPENGGIGVFAHESAHNIGGDDLYSYAGGETSAGFWTLAADDWTGFPIGFCPPSMDPWHQDNWGWLEPYVISDPTKVYTVTLGQAGDFPGGTGVYRGAKIALPDGFVPLPVQPQGEFEWWGGKANQANAMMTLRSPIAIPAAGATLAVSMTYDIEELWDFLWAQASADGGQTWETLTNANTVCQHDASWIGAEYGFPEDMCAEGIGGFTGTSAEFPDWGNESFDLAAFAGQSILLRFWYMTDWGTTFSGPYLDNVVVMGDDGSTILSSSADAANNTWAYSGGWERGSGTQRFTHNYYLQWRNTNENGGYDKSLGDPRFRFGPVNTGLLVWYNNNYYTDNEIINYLNDYFGFGPKGRMLVVDSHPEPYRDPYWLSQGYAGEATNVNHRSLMRDAPFTLQNTVPFTMANPYVFSPTVQFSGRPAVSTFTDALGWYPGAENVVRGPLQPAAGWSTVHWDSSVAIPAKDFYGIKAPGYTASERMRFGNAIDNNPNSANYRYVLAYSYPAGLGYNGGTGNPGDRNVQYGWRVELIEEAPDHTWATVRVSNVQPMQVSYTPQWINTTGNQNITYTVTLNNSGVLTQTRQFTFTLDANLTYVTRTWSSGVAGGQTFGWSGVLAPGATQTFTLVASEDVTALTPPYDLTTRFAYNDGINPVVTQSLVTHVGSFSLTLPLVFKNYLVE